MTQLFAPCNSAEFSNGLSFPLELRILPGHFQRFIQLHEASPNLLTLHSSMLSEYVGGSSKQKKSLTTCKCFNRSLPIIELTNVCKPCTRLSRNPAPKLSPKNFFRGSVNVKFGSIVFSLWCKRTKSVYRRSTSQQSFLNGFSTRNLYT